MGSILPCGFGFGHVTHGRLILTMKQAVVIKSLFFFLIIDSSDRCGYVDRVNC